MRALAEILSNGCRREEEEPEAVRVDREHNEMLIEDYEIRRRELKVLLLGRGSSGKSTILKQIKMNYGGGYSREEHLAMKADVYSTVVKGMAALCQSRDELAIRISQADRDDVNAIKALAESGEHNRRFSEPMLECLRRQWNSATNQEAFQARSQVLVPDTIAHFMQDIDRISGENYCPSMADVLRVNVPTTALGELAFSFPQRKRFRIFEECEYRECGNRRWYSMRDEGFNAIIFVVAINEYDHPVIGGSMLTNRLRRAQAMFEEICADLDDDNDPEQNYTMILLLNKQDLFEERLPSSRLADQFIDYEGSPNPEVAKAYIQTEFEESYRRTGPHNGYLYIHFTSAIDSGPTVRALTAAFNSIIQDNVARTDVQ